MARFSGSRGGLEKSIARDLAGQLSKEVSKQVRNAGIEICNGLVEAGPVWSGRFSASWDITPQGTPPRTRKISTLSGPYQYTYRNFPLRIFQDTVLQSMLLSRPIVFQVVNTSPYAAIATDEEEGVFFPVGRPIKTPVMRGWGRPEEPHLRFQIGINPRMSKSMTGQTITEEPNSSITARQYWFQTYSRGGGLQRDLGRGMSIAAIGALP